jgi:serine/threonine-protein kinase RsbW
MSVGVAGDCLPALRLQIRGDALSVRQALATVSAALDRQAVVADDRANAELVLAEVLNNVVEHAYRDRGEGEIELTLKLGAGDLTCAVTDGGLPLPGGRLPTAGPEPRPDDLPEGGFGWTLIMALCQDLDYRRSGGRNRLSFTIPAARRA